MCYLANFITPHHYPLFKTCNAARKWLLLNIILRRNKGFPVPKLLHAMTNEEIRPYIINVLEKICSGSMTRREAALWADAFKKQEAPHAFYENMFLPWGGMQEAFLAIVNAEISENFSTKGEPYFFKNADFKEYFLIVNKIDAPSTREIFQPIRPHQLLKPLDNSLLIFSKTIEAILPDYITPLRGHDELDFHKEAVFKNSSGTPFRFIQHMRSKIVGTDVFVAQEDCTREVLIEFIADMKTAPKDIFWIPAHLLPL